MSNKVLTYADCVKLGDEFLAIIDVLKQNKLVYTGNINFSVVQKTETVYSVQLKDKTYTYSLLEMSQSIKRSKVLNISNWVISFPALTYPKTKALSYIFGKNVKHVYSIQTGLRYLTKVVDQAQQLMLKAKLRDKTWVAMVAVMYCSVRKNSAAYYSRFQNENIHSVSDTLKFLKLGLTPGEVIEQWEKKIDPDMFREVGDIWDDLPEHMLKALTTES
jgi:hypothetical protein